MDVINVSIKADVPRGFIVFPTNHGKITYIPKDYPILSLNKECALFIHNVGLLKFVETHGYLLKDLLYKEIIRTPFYVFNAERRSMYGKDLVLVPKLIRDGRNVPKNTTTLLGHKTKETIYHEFG